MAKLSVAQLLSRINFHRTNSNLDFNGSPEGDENMKLRLNIEGLLTSDTMRKQATLSLKQRVELAKASVLKISVAGLCKAYQKEGIKFKNIRFQRHWRRDDD